MNNDWALIINISYKHDKVVRLNGYTRKCPQLAAAYIITCPDRLDSDYRLQYDVVTIRPPQSQVMVVQENWGLSLIRNFCSS